MAFDANLASKLVSVDQEATQDPFHFPQCAPLVGVVSCTMLHEKKIFFSYFCPAVDSTKLSRETFGRKESRNLVRFVQGLCCFPAQLIHAQPFNWLNGVKWKKNKGRENPPPKPWVKL